MWQSEENWPTNYGCDITVQWEDPEVKRDTLVHVVVDAPLHATDHLLTYFSDWRKLKVSVAWFLRLKAVLMKLSRQRWDGKTSNNIRIDLMEKPETRSHRMEHHLNSKGSAGGGVVHHSLLSTAKTQC